MKTSDCDSLHDKFRKFNEEILNSELLSKFNSDDGVDKFYYDALNHRNEFAALWQLLRNLLLLSHRQSQAEGGFPINKEVSDTNIEATSLIAKQRIEDHVRSLGGLENFIVTKDLLQSCKSSRQNYQIHLNEKRATKERKKKLEKRKAVEKTTTYKWLKKSGTKIGRTC